MSNNSHTANSRLLATSPGDNSAKVSSSLSIDQESRSNGDAHRPSYCNRLILRIPHHIDVFGFNLTLPQFAVFIVLAFASLGSNGGLAFLIAMGAYTGFQRLTSSANSSHSNASGRYRGTRWSGGGANVRGVGDLPKPPPSG